MDDIGAVNSVAGVGLPAVAGSAIVVVEAEEAGPGAGLSFGGWIVQEDEDPGVYAALVGINVWDVALWEVFDAGDAVRKTVKRRDMRLANPAHLVGDDERVGVSTIDRNHPPYPLADAKSHVEASVQRPGEAQVLKRLLRVLGL